MNTKKALLVTGVTAAVGLASVGGVVSAVSVTSTDTATGTDARQSLIDKLASKFNLNKDEVKQVFDENRAEKEKLRGQKFEERLTQAVKDGKITDAQKSQILAKQQELKTYIDSVKDKNPDERKKLIKAKLDELHQWAKDNGLEKYMHGALRQGRHGMRHEMRMGGEPAAASPSDMPAAEQDTQPGVI